MPLNSVPVPGPVPQALQSPQPAATAAQKKNSGCAVLLLGLLVVVIVVTCARTLSDSANDGSEASTAASKPAKPTAPPKSATESLAEANDSALSAAARKGRAEMVIQNFPGTEEAKAALALVAEMDKQIAIENIGKQWRYASAEDGMSGKAQRNAYVTSTNTFQFDFPYNGTQRATLQIRKHPRYGNDVIFEIEKGQILCHSYSCPVRIRFDDGAPRTYTGNEPADNSSTYVFIPGFADLTQRIARAKRMRVEVNVYQQGAIQAEFDVEGFNPKKLSGG